MSELSELEIMASGVWGHWPEGRGREGGVDAIDSAGGVGSDRDGGDCVVRSWVLCFVSLVVHSAQNARSRPQCERWAHSARAPLAALQYPFRCSPNSRSPGLEASQFLFSWVRDASFGRDLLCAP